MDPRHTLYKTLNRLSIDPENTNAMSARTDTEAETNAADSGVTAESIERKLRDVLGAEYVEIADLSGKLFYFSRALVILIWLRTLIWAMQVATMHNADLEIFRWMWPNV